MEINTVFKYIIFSTIICDPNIKFLNYIGFNFTTHLNTTTFSDNICYLRRIKKRNCISYMVRTLINVLKKPVLKPNE